MSSLAYLLTIKILDVQLSRRLVYLVFQLCVLCPGRCRVVLHLLDTQLPSYQLTCRLWGRQGDRQQSIRQDDSDTLFSCKMSISLSVCVSICLSAHVVPAIAKQRKEIARSYFLSPCQSDKIMSQGAIFCCFVKATKKCFFEPPPPSSLSPCQRDKATFLSEG